MPQQPGSPAAADIAWVLRRWFYCLPSISGLNLLWVCCCFIIFKLALLLKIGKYKVGIELISWSVAAWGDDLCGSPRYNAILVCRPFATIILRASLLPMQMTVSQKSAWHKRNFKLYSNHCLWCRDPNISLLFFLL